jgi:hypothetical protein
MNFREVLATANQTPFDMSRPLKELPPLEAMQVSAANGVVTTLGEQVQRYCELPPAYRYLAWQAIAVVDAAAQSSGHRNEQRIRALVDASMAGIASMVRYVSILPYVYAAHRPEFPGMPPDVNEQTVELGQIARRSNVYLGIVAAQSIQVSGVIERDDYLRGSLPGNPRYWQDCVRHNFVLAEAKDGLCIDARGDIAMRTRTIKDSYHRAVPDGRNLERAPGCLALQVVDENGKSVFDAMWDRFVTVSTDDPRFFVSDLQRIADLNNREG